VTDNVYCLVKIIQKDERIIAAVQVETKLFDFFTSLNSSLIIFIRTYTVNCRNALDRLRVHMNIILFLRFLCYSLRICAGRNVSLQQFCASPFRRKVNLIIGSTSRFMLTIESRPKKTCLIMHCIRRMPDGLKQFTA